MTIEEQLEALGYDIYENSFGKHAKKYVSETFQAWECLQLENLPVGIEIQEVGCSEILIIVRFEER